MRLDDIARLSTRMFKTNPSRTWLTILGMGVGTGAVVLMVGLGFGLQNIILEEIVFGESMLSLEVSSMSEQALPITDSTLREFHDMELVKDLAPQAGFPAMITHRGLTGNIRLEGIDPNYLLYAGVQVTAGEPLTPESPPDDILLSPSVLQLFGMEDEEEAIGEQVNFRVLVPSADNPDQTREVNLDGSYNIVGITDDDTALAAMIPLNEIRQHVQVDTYERVQVRVVDDEALDPVTEAMVDEGYDVFALSETVEQAQAIFQIVQIVLAVFGGVALTVSAIGMFNTMTVTLLERTSEIGVMRTLGASPNDIKILFVAEAVIVGFLGGICGILMGVVIGLGLNPVLNFIATRFGGEAVSLFAFPLWFLLFIAIFSAVVGFMTGIFPARRAANLNPLDAIRD